MNRTQTILLVVFVVQAALIAAGAVSGPETAGTAELRALLPDLGSFAADKIKIEADSGKESVTLAREGEGWVLESAGGYPANSERVAQLLEKLGGLEVRRPSVTQSRYHQALKVEEDEFERRVQIWDQASGEPKVDLIVGTAPNYRISNARLAGEDAVYAVPGLAAFDLQAQLNTWAADAFPEDLYDEATWFKLENAAGAIELQKQDEQWALVEPSLAPRPLDSNKVSSLVRAVNSLYVVRPIGAVDEEAQGLTDPEVRVSLLLGEAPVADEETGETPEDARREVVIRIGGLTADDETQRYLNRVDFGFTSAIRDSACKRLREETLESLMVEPEPEAPPEEASPEGEAAPAAAPEAAPDGESEAAPEAGQEPQPDALPGAEEPEPPGDGGR